MSIKKTRNFQSSLQLLYFSTPTAAVDYMTLACCFRYSPYDHTHETGFSCSQKWMFLHMWRCERLSAIYHQQSIASNSFPISDRQCWALIDPWGKSCYLYNGRKIVPLKLRLVLTHSLNTQHILTHSHFGWPAMKLSFISLLAIVSMHSVFGLPQAPREAPFPSSLICVFDNCNHRNKAEVTVWSY